MAVLRPARLSVNINKVATLRNSRGGRIPNVLEVAQRAQDFGAEGITIHPRPDERHIRYADARALRAVVRTEFNIEGYPSRDFIDLVLECAPEQVTLVPDAPDVLTSNAGWNTLKHASMLQQVLAEFRAAGIRTSLFMECNFAHIKAAKDLGADRIELYTEAFAQGYQAALALRDGGDQAGFDRLRTAAVQPYADAAELAHSLGLGVNAGHDLNADNLAFFAASVPQLDEVSIGHALIADALYLGLENSIQRYRYQLELGAQQLLFLSADLVHTRIMAAVGLSSKILGAGGRPLIVLHGFLGMGDNWASHARIWADQGFEVHLVDQRNHGRSPHNSNHSYTEMVQDALAYAESNFKPGPLAWLGHSMGGKVVMEFAARYPSWVERMVVVDIGPKAYPPHHQYIIDAMKSLNLLELGSRTEADRAIEVYLKDWGIRQFLLKNLEWNSDKHLGWRCNLPVLEASMSRIGKPLGPLDYYVGACLFVRGLESNYVSDEDWPGIVKHFPAAQLESVAGAGHWVHAEQPQAFQLAVGSFLKS